MHVVERHSLEHLTRLAKRQTKVRRWVRLQVIIRAKRGETAAQVAAVMNVSRRTLQQWVHRYNTDGLEGLKDRRRPNHRHLTDAQEQQLVRHLYAAAEDPQGDIRRGEDVRQWINGHFGVLYSLNGIYDLLHRLGYRYLMPRPRHRKADRQAQEAFKKTRWITSGTSPNTIHSSTPRSGSRMKRGSANKAR